MTDVDHGASVPVSGVFYEHSPDMRHDLPGEPDDPATAPPLAPATAVDTALLKARQTELAGLMAASDALPYGSEVAVAFQRAGEALGLTDAEHETLAGQWTPTFQAHCISGDDATALIGVGVQAARDGEPDEATEAAWTADTLDSLAREFGGSEAAERAASLARQYVARDPRLVEWLEETRLGSHPRVVLAIARAASNARRAGKF